MRLVVLDESRAEVEMLRNRGCDKLYEDEDEDEDEGDLYLSV